MFVVCLYVTLCTQLNVHSNSFLLDKVLGHFDVQTVTLVMEIFDFCEPCDVDLDRSLNFRPNQLSPSAIGVRTNLWRLKQVSIGGPRSVRQRSKRSPFFIHYNIQYFPVTIINYQLHYLSHSSLMSHWEIVMNIEWLQHLMFKNYQDLYIQII